MASDVQVSGMNQEEIEAGEVRLILVAGFLSVILIQIARAVLTEGWNSEGIFHDADVYMWMVRVEALWEGRGWFEHLETRVNPPEGHVQHWTRPLDFLLLAGGALLAPLVGFREGLAFWTAMISPVLHLLAMIGVYRLGKLVMSDRDAALSAGIFGLQFITIVTFLWGRGDHHSLLTFGQVFFVLGLAAVFLGERERWSWSIGTGAAGAWSIWVNAEALGYVLIGLALLGLWWLAGGREKLRSAAGVGLGLLLGMIFAVLVERGPEFFQSFPIDTIGIAYVTLFGLTALYFLGLWLAREKWNLTEGLGGRAVVAGVFALAVFGGLWALHPEFFGGPFDGVDPLYRELRLSNLSEQAPALRFGSEPGFYLFGYGLVWFGLLAPALLGGAIRFRRGEKKEQWIWATMLLMALGFAVLALGQIRWLAYMPLGAALGAGVLGGEIMNWFDRQKWYSAEIGRPVLIMVFLFGITVTGLGIAALGSEEPPAAAALAEDGDGEVEEERLYFGPECDMRRAAAILNEWAAERGPGLVLLEPDRGSEVLYRTEHQVLTIANHRIQPGFAFFVETMREKSLEEGVASLSRRGVDLVMICTGSVWSSLRGSPEEPSLKEKLAAGRHGERLEALARPAETGGWWIYEVVGAKGRSSAGSEP